MNTTQAIPRELELQAWISSQLAGLLEVDSSEISLDKGFGDLGLDSVGYLHLSIAIEERFELSVTAKEIFLHSNVESLSHFLIEYWQRLKVLATNLPNGFADYMTVNTGGQLAPLFWLNGYEFLELCAEYLPSDRPIYYLHHQGSDGKAARHRSIEAMAEFYIETLLHIDPQGPYCLGGYSIGGTIAYEMAQRLMNLGKKVEILLLLSPAGEPLRLKHAFLDRERQRVSAESPFRKWLHMTRKHIGLRMRQVAKKRSQLSGRIKVYSYILTGRSIPSRLIWTHMQPIYARARLHYRISPYRGDVMVAHETSISVDEWSESVLGRFDVVPPIPVSHLELLSGDCSGPWLKDFVAPIGLLSANSVVSAERNAEHLEERSKVESPESGSRVVG